MLNADFRSCPVCGFSGESRVYAEANIHPKLFSAYTFASRKVPEYMHARLVECPVCDLVYANPVPKSQDLATAYETASFDSAREASYAARTYRYILTLFLDRLPDLEGALDVGTGDGAFLRELLRIGFTRVAGVEPSRAPVEAADPEIRPLIRLEMFGPESYAPESFSLVTCFQTIEHLEDPLTICRTACRTLKPGGVLFLIGHNRRAFSALLLGRKSPIFDIEHLQLFSQRSVSYMLQLAGFEEITVAGIYNRYPLSYWMRLFPLPGVIKRSIIKMLDASRIGRLPLPLPAGNFAGIA